jgi:hypothetical protein
VLTNLRECVMTVTGPEFIGLEALGFEELADAGAIHDRAHRA